MLRLLPCVLLVVLSACGDATEGTPDSPNETRPDAAVLPDAAVTVPDGPAALCADPDPAVVGDGGVAGALAALPGVANLSSGPGGDQYTRYAFTFRQLVDHTDRSAGTFAQRVILFHLDATRAVVLGTQGYDLGLAPLREDPTRILQANQIEVEHRFFGSSTPPGSPRDWNKLTIWQAAADDHCLVATLKGIYRAPWVATGQSKGGMTALFYRRFFPDDVAATVAYVTPISLGAPDRRYVDWVEDGKDPDCRQKLRDFQRLALTHRDEIEAHMMTLSTTYALLGLDEAFEHLVLELPFGFWQFGNDFACAAIPDETAAIDAIIEFLDTYGDFFSYGDTDLARFAAYYVQAATQLGYPEISEDNLAGMLHHPGTDIAPSYVPVGAPTTYDPLPMREISAWVHTQGERLLFVYGETDAWSGGMVELGNAVDSYRFIVPNGNHASVISGLAPDDRDAAIGALERWTAAAAKGKMAP